MDVAFGCEFGCEAFLLLPPFVELALDLGRVIGINSCRLLDLFVFLFWRSCRGSGLLYLGLLLLELFILFGLFALLLNYSREGKKSEHVIHEL